MGAGAKQEFRFRAVAKGAETLRLTYGHPWEETGQRTWEPTIVVK
jgi:predicted secreted protein